MGCLSFSRLMVRTPEGGRRTCAFSAMEGLEFMVNCGFNFKRWQWGCSRLSISILSLMLNLFFQKNEHWKFKLLNGETFLQVSNNLDSQYYALERVKNGEVQYLHQNYFLEPHPQIVTYYTSWHEQETVTEEVPIPKKIKEKKSMVGALLNKKSRGEANSSKIAPPKEIKEETILKTTVENVLYIQLQSFSEVNVPTLLPDVKEFLALIYLQALRVYDEFKCWPRMLPVIVESEKFKFIKKGKTLHHQLVSLFEFVAKDKKAALLAQWSQPLAAMISDINSPEKVETILGQFLQTELEAILEKQYSLNLRKGQQIIPVTVLISNPFTLVLKEQMMSLKIDEFEISYFHQNSETRQIVMDHDLDGTVVLEGDRNSFIIKYLKQFVMS